jgi:hypothetical protein
VAGARPSQQDFRGQGAVIKDVAHQQSSRLIVTACRHELLTIDTDLTKRVILSMGGERRDTRNPTSFYAAVRVG